MGSTPAEKGLPTTKSRCEGSSCHEIGILCMRRGRVTAAGRKRANATCGFVRAKRGRGAPIAPKPSSACTLSPIRGSSATDGSMRLAARLAAARPMAARLTAARDWQQRDWKQRDWQQQRQRATGSATPGAGAGALPAWLNVRGGGAPPPVRSPVRSPVLSGSREALEFGEGRAAGGVFLSTAAPCARLAPYNRKRCARVPLRGVAVPFLRLS